MDDFKSGEKESEQYYRWLKSNTEDIKLGIHENI